MNGTRIFTDAADKRGFFKIYLRESIKSVFIHVPFLKCAKILKSPGVGELPIMAGMEIRD